MEINYSMISENAHIMVVDDTIENLSLLTKMLKDCGYTVRPVPNGRLALQAAKNNPPDLVLLDITMPEMDGYEVCRQLKHDPRLKDIPVLFISAVSQSIDKLKAFEVGGVDFISKPFQFEEVRARVETHLSLSRFQHGLEEQVRSQIKKIYDLQMGMIFALAKLAETRDNDTGKHLERIQTLCKTIALELVNHPDFQDEVDETFPQRIYQASPLHDIGKVGIPDHILLKPGKLTADEYEIMKTHVTIGAKTLEDVQLLYGENQFLQMGIRITKYHHEKWNGKGYPENLQEKEIPLEARIMAIADVYDALRSKRVYKPSVSHTETIRIIQEDSGSHFDPKIVAALIKIEKEVETTWLQLIA